MKALLSLGIHHRGTRVMVWLSGCASLSWVAATAGALALALTLVLYLVAVVLRVLQ